MDASGYVDPNSHGVVVVAASLGGLRTLECILATIPIEFPVPIVVVQHLSERHPTCFTDLLEPKSTLPVRWIRHGDAIGPGVVRVAPPGRHAVIATGGRTLALLDSPPVNFSRPSADPLFVSAALQFGNTAIGVVLSGRLSDGKAGAVAIRRAGGVVIAQQPDTCAAASMPQSAIAAGSVHFVLPPNAISRALTALTMMPGARAMFGWPRAA